MPFGFIGTELACYAFAINNLQDLTPFIELTFEQKKRLVTECWKQGFWDDDVVIKNERIIRGFAIKLVRNLKKSEFEDEEPLNNEKKIAKILLEITLIGYESMYERLYSMDIERYPLPKIVEEPWDDTESSEYHKLKPFTIINKTRKPIEIYKRHKDGSEEQMNNVKPDEKHSEKNKPDFIGQVWLARSKESQAQTLQSNIMSSFMALPGCKTWEIADFPPDQFLPSMEPDKKKEKRNISIINNLMTYVSLYMVRSTGQLHYLYTLSPTQKKVTMADCNVGYSFVAIQGTTVFSKFRVLSFLRPECEWHIGKSMEMDRQEEIYKTGENNYIYYHVNIQQNDTVKHVTKTFAEQKFKILTGTNYLYGSIDSNVPSSKIEVRVTDPYGKRYYLKKKNYNFVKEKPRPGEWKVKVSVKGHTPLFFQIQTTPTKDPYETIRKTFEEDSSKAEASDWKDFVYRGLIGMICDSHWDLVNHMIGTPAKSLNKLQNILEIKDLVKLLYNAVSPRPRGLPNILLADANDDVLTENLFSARNEYIYSYVESSRYKNNLLTLTKVNTIDFQSHLRNESIRLVSFGGHATEKELYGHSSTSEGAVLTSNDVEKDRRLAEDKIFHFIACSTGSDSQNSLGKTLCRNGASAFIGYKDKFKLIRSSKFTPEELVYDHDFGNTTYKTQYRPDIELVKALLDGKTVKQAFEICIPWYDLLANKKNYAPSSKGLVKHNQDQLVIYGDENAVLDT